MDKNYVYPYSYESAKHNGEGDTLAYSESKKQNIACARAIEKAIADNFDGFHLNAETANGVITEFGYDRVNWVLTNTIQRKKEDGRFSQSNKEWAKGFFIPLDKVAGYDHREDFVVDSHPAVLDVFVKQSQKKYQALKLWDSTHCNTREGLNYECKVMVINPTMLGDKYKSPDYQLVFAQSGFGCSPDASGRKVYGKFLFDGEDCQFQRADFIGELKGEHLPDWAVEKLQVIQGKAQTQSSPEMTM